MHEDRVGGRETFLGRGIVGLCFRFYATPLQEALVAPGRGRR